MTLGTGCSGARGPSYGGASGTTAQWEERWRSWSSAATWTCGTSSPGERERL